MSNLKSAIYGLAVGDALGVPFEFKTRGSFTCDDMIGYGTHNQVAGTWSDDTSMTLATCKSIKDNNLKININDITHNFKAWLYNSKFTAFDKVFDCGITTQMALNSGKGLDNFRSNGNGSLMRILPLAFIDCEKEDIEKVSSITHAHYISKEGCTIYINIAKSLLNGFNLKDILYNLDVSTTYSRLKILDKLTINDVKSTGYVVHTLEASLWCLLNTKNYKEAVLQSINLGDDTDTVGAVTGGLAGIIYGYDSIPANWLNTLQNKSLINECLFL